MSAFNGSIKVVELSAVLRQAPAVSAELAPEDAPSGLVVPAVAKHQGELKAKSGPTGLLTEAC